MKYLVVEIQKWNNGQLAQSTTVHGSRQEAEQKYHEVLMYAAVSEVNVHSAAMLDETGGLIKNETYYHGDAE